MTHKYECYTRKVEIHLPKCQLDQYPKKHMNDFIHNEYPIPPWTLYNFLIWSELVQFPLEHHQFCYRSYQLCTLRLNLHGPNQTVVSGVSLNHSRQRPQMPREVFIRHQHEVTDTYVGLFL